MTTSKTQPAGPKALSAPLQGALYMILAAFIFSIMNVIIRIASETIDPLQIAFFRNLFALLIMLPWIAGVGLSSLRTERIGTHIARAAVGLCAMTCWFYSIHFLPLAEAVALNFTTPLFATAGAALILHEVVRARRWTATALGFLGVLIILRPGFTALSPEMALPVVAAVFMACSTLIVKSLSRTDSTTAIVVYMNLFLTPLSLIPALFVWRWPDPLTFVLLASVGVLAAIAHFAMTHAYTKADASAILPFDYARLPFVAIMSFIVFGQTVDTWTWVGAGVIAASAIYIARREAQVARQRLATPVAGHSPRGGT